MKSSTPIKEKPHSTLPPVIGNPSPSKQSNTPTKSVYVEKKSKQDNQYYIHRTKPITYNHKPIRDLNKKIPSHFRSNLMQTRPRLDLKYRNFLISKSQRLVYHLNDYLRQFDRDSAVVFTTKTYHALLKLYEIVINFVFQYQKEIKQY